MVRFDKSDEPTCVFLVSGRSGVGGAQLLSIALTHFARNVQIEVRRYVRNETETSAVVAEAANRGAGIIHTLANETLRCHLVREAEEVGVLTLDLMGPLLSMLSVLTKTTPVGQPKHHPWMHAEYFNRVEAMRFTTLHDDGARLDDIDEAEIVLLGVSRSGKTPLSVYLSVLGWKTANVPIVPDLPLPAAVTRLDRRRVFGLTIEFERLISHRKKRCIGTGAVLPGYTDKSKVFAELEWARTLYRKQRCRIIDVTDKPIESSAEEILEQVSGCDR